MAESKEVDSVPFQNDADNKGVQSSNNEEASPPPTQVIPEVEKNTTEIEDRFRAMLERPKMTPEEREKKKQELIRRQKEARQQAVELTPKSTVVESREDLISKAVNFLSSPSAISADEEKKIQFLLNKGLTREEIDIAKERAGTLSAPPAVPPRTYPLHVPTVMHAPPMTVARTPMWKKLAYMLLITGSFSALMIIAIKKLLGPMVTAVICAKQQLYSHQLSLLRKFNEKLSSFVTLSKKDSIGSSRLNKINELDDDEDNDLTTLESKVNEPPSLLAPLSTDLSNLSEQIYLHQQNLLKSEAMEDLQHSLTSLTTYLSTNVFTFTSLSTANEDVEQVKNEIRSIKGSLIGRSNFPKIPLLTRSETQPPSSPTSLYPPKRYQPIS
ncbi:13227_t:CDS:2 [Acaulospora morrowiae]|uniref:Peroxisomal membrane protein PEX14 n=1 Tax=Acaulospora morrowiae TaxID=94023 RepID=A0A9N8YVF1_9GLOM|nr:13227_t:CDS:2 [Acaulospora morrowiae]